MDNKNSELIPLAKAAKLTNYSQEYISLLCRRGKIKGKKLGRNWFTTKEWVDDYINKTNGSGEIVIPVRIENKTKNEKKETVRTGKMSMNPLLLVGKLMFAVVIFSFLTSGLILLGQGVLDGTIRKTENSQQRILKPSDNIIYPGQNNKAVSSNEIKSGKVAGALNKNDNEKSPLLNQREQNLFDTVYHKLMRFIVEQSYLKNKIDEKAETDCLDAPYLDGDNSENPLRSPVITE